MNFKYKRILQHLFVNDFCWYIASPFIYISKRLMLSRENFITRKAEDENTAICSRLFFQKTVLNGIFKELHFENIKATSSSIYSKLLGSYELELAPVLQKLLANPYTHFINVGCDEGYYAVGIAKLKPGIKVIAFDCNKTAGERCKVLAKANLALDNITVKGCFSFTEIDDIPAQSKTLFIIDCEGCENDIINAGLIKKFTTADFIVELHYQENPLILSKLQQLFSATHKISLINALSDHERVMNYDFPELENLSYTQKDFILNERNGFMQWLIAESFV